MPAFQPKTRTSIYKNRRCKLPGAMFIHLDKSTGADMKRRGLSKALLHAEPGDVLVVGKLDRLSRSLFDLVTLMQTCKVRISAKL